MTLMADEIASIPDVVAGQLDAALDLYLKAGQDLDAKKPTSVITCARGSSDHAAFYFKYLIEMQLGLPVCSMGPSIVSVYDRRLQVDNAAIIAVSQSGGSRDIIALMDRARADGASGFALVNNISSGLAKSAETVLPMMAGLERSVAATKTLACSLVALASIVAGWTGDLALLEAIRRLPERLNEALLCDWHGAIGPVSQLHGLFVVSRGPSFAIASEAALKLKETCRLQAEAYSAAEVRHGPIALAGEGFTALALATRDPSAKSIREAIDLMRGAGARVLVAGLDGSDQDSLPTSEADHVLLDPICQIVSFYRFVEALSVYKGFNPDKPAHLSKVTVTV